MTDTTAQLITELEKRGVLTWEVGDVAVYDGLSCSVFFVSSGTLGGFDWQAYAKDCTHSAEDPRLLGRVLPLLGKITFDMHGRNPATTLIALVNGIGTIFRAGTLIEAALKALLAKVEGEQS